MQLHANAALSLNQRRRMVGRVVGQGWSLTKAAEAAEVSERTCAKWVRRYRAQGDAGLRDRSSAPHQIPHRTPEDRVEVLELLRRLRMTSSEIAECLGMALSTVSAVLKRIGLGKLSRLDPLEPPNRYERRQAGELLHIDVKKLGRINGAGWRVTGNRASQNANRRARRKGGPAGWEFVHVCVDDATRLAYAEVLDDEKATTAIALLRPGLLRRPRHHRAARHDRQRRRLPLDRARPRLPHPRRPSPAHPTQTATHQRQGRTLPQVHDRRLERRRHLRHQPRTRRRPQRLALDLQSPTTPRRPQPPPAHRSPQRAEQPAWVLHLVAALVALEGG
jgi:transposase